MKRYKINAYLPKREKQIRWDFKKLFSSSLNLFRDDPNSYSPSLDLHHTNTSKNPKPAIIILPGGAYFARDKTNEGTKVSDFFAQAGLVPFILNYRVAPFELPIPFHDGLNAIKYIREHSIEFNINPNKIGMIGFSAGGHIVSTLSSHILNPSFESKINFQILGYPLIDIASNSIKNYFVKNIIHNKNIYQKSLDTSSLINTSTPPSFIWHSKYDTVVHYSHSIRYYNRLKEYPVLSKLKIYKSGIHGVGLASSNYYKNKDVSCWPEDCLDWLKKIRVL